jgi:hypothetical protein
MWELLPDHHDKEKARDALQDLGSFHLWARPPTNRPHPLALSLPVKVSGPPAHPAWAVPPFTLQGFRNPGRHPGGGVSSRFGLQEPQLWTLQS